MADEEALIKICESSGCDNEAKLRCPTCVKLNIKGSHFCSQECFKYNWIEHKAVHKLAKGTGAIITDTNDAYNPWPGYSFTGKLRPHPISSMRTVPKNIIKTDYADHTEGFPASECAMRGSTSIQILNDDDKEDLRIACKYGREVLDVAAQAIGIGVTTEEIDKLVHEACIERDCYPSPLNYYNFPKSCCTSINEVICHGIPDMRPLQDGDIINVDITTYHNDFHGDLNETFFVGNVDESGRKLVQTAYECMMNSIDIVHPGIKYREIGDVIQKHAQGNGFSVVRTYCGHGIHRLFHTAPCIPHYARNKAVGVMKPGHSFTIEPMISEGSWRDKTWPDNWTAVTVDGKRSAQFEHTMLVTDDGVEILTARQHKDGQPWFMDVL